MKKKNQTNNIGIIWQYGREKKKKVIQLSQN